MCLSPHYTGTEYSNNSELTSTRDRSTLVTVDKLSGRALAVKLYSSGKSVIACGRREEQLDSLQKELGNERCATVPWDITDLPRIPDMANRIMTHYGSSVYAVVIVSGIQRTTDFTQPDVSVSAVSSETSSSSLLSGVEP